MPRSHSHTMPTARTRARRAALKLASCALVPAAGVVLASSASAAPTHNPFGHIDSITAASGRATVTGWTADPDAPAATVTVILTLDSRHVGHVYTGGYRPDVARARHTGSHAGFRATVGLPAGRHTLCLIAANRGLGRAVTLGCHTFGPPPVSRNAAIAHTAAHYVGARYTEGGASPQTGFDCSGLVQYVYRTAAHITVTHNAQDQYAHAHRLPAARAAAGDLVFFHDSRGQVYHVGIYAGSHRMWAAATPRDGVRYQNIWSSAVSYGSYTHAS